MKIIRLTEEYKENYEKFVAKHSKALFYYGLKYRDLLKNLLSCEEEYYILLKCQDIKGILPILYKNGKYGKVYNSLAYFGSNGAILADNEECYNLLLEKYNEIIKTSVVSVYIENPIDIHKNKPDHDYVSNRICQISSFDANIDMDDLSKLFTSNKRNDIRKAVKNDIVVEIDNSQNAKKFLLSTHIDNMKAIGGIHKEEALFSSFYSLYKEGKDFNIFIAKKDGEQVAALFVLYFNGMTEYYTPVILNKYRDLQPLAILIYDAIKYSVNKGFLNWNWGGNGISLNSVYKFKKRWGAEDYKYDYYIKLNDKEFLNLDKNMILSEYKGFFTIPFNLFSEGK